MEMNTIATKKQDLRLLLAILTLTLFLAVIIFKMDSDYAETMLLGIGFMSMLLGLNYTFRTPPRNTSRFVFVANIWLVVLSYYLLLASIVYLLLWNIHPDTNRFEPRFTLFLTLFVVASYISDKLGFQTDIRNIILRMLGVKEATTELTESG